MIDLSTLSPKIRALLPDDTIKIYEQKIIYHEKQFQLYRDNSRFVVIAAGRRSGKTFKAKRKLVKRASITPGLYFCAAPTFPQAKGIFWTDLKAYFPPFVRSRRPNETSCILYLANGSEIRILGLDNAARFEGQPWTGGIIDETDDLKKDAWPSHIRPALDTIGLETWVILCGVPEGKYLLYDLSKNAIVDDNWSFYHWLSAEVLPPEAIAAAKRDMSPLQYRQEYEASFETASGCVYSDYSSLLNKSNAILSPRLPIRWMHDFNYVPLSSAIMQQHDDGYHVLDEIVLKSAVARNSALEFVERYKDHQNKRCLLFGDYSGTSGEKHNQSSDYKEIEKVLRKSNWHITRHVRPNPRIKNRQNSLRGLICNHEGERRLFVRIDKCKYTDKGLSRTSLMEGSSYQEVEDDFQHITTALGYWAHTEHPIINGVAGQIRG